MPPKAAPANGRPKGADAPLHQSREAHHPARPLHSPEGRVPFQVGPWDWVANELRRGRSSEAWSGCRRGGHPAPLACRLRSVGTWTGLVGMREALNAARP